MKPTSKRILIGACSVITILLLFRIPCIAIEKIDPTAFQIDTGPEIQIADTSAYEPVALPRVSVVDFTNNSYGADSVPVDWWWWKDIERKLPAIVADSVIDEIVNIGGAKVFTRTEMQKILQEHKLQLSKQVDNNTLEVDNNTLIEFGKIAGVAYIITGSINDINFNTVTEERTYKELFTGRKWIKTVTETRADVELALRMIDVTTGEIILATRVKGDHILEGDDAVAVISAIKKSCGEALKDIRPKFSKIFTLRGYILQTRTSPDNKKRIALINIGEKNGLKAGQKVFIYTFQEIKDPFSDKSIWDKVKLPVEGEVTDQVQKDKAWILLKGDIDQVRRVATGALVERVPIKKPGFFEKIFGK